MPSILLINENKIVSRLLQLSSQKQGYNLEELNNLGSSSTSYDVIFVDSDLFNDELLENIKTKFTYNHLGFIGAKKDSVPEGFDISIEKPFLPTDFVNLIKEQVIPTLSKTESVDEDLLVESNELDIDDETELLLDDDLGLDTLEESDDLTELDDTPISKEDILDDVDLSLDSSTVMTTGIATNMMQTENNHEELVDMISEIDDMDSEENEELEKVEEISLQNNLVELNDAEELDTLDDNIIDEDIAEVENLIEDSLADEKLDIQESKSEKNLQEDITATTVGALATVGVVASDILTDDTDYKDSEVNVDELDTLDETQIKEALGEEIVENDTAQNVKDIIENEPVEEIISEKVDAPVVDETMVESNDVEQWIRDAVAKAITPQMIKEALDGMDVNVTLSFNSKKED